MAMHAGGTLRRAPRAQGAGCGMRRGQGTEAREIWHSNFFRRRAGNRITAVHRRGSRNGARTCEKSYTWPLFVWANPSRHPNMPGATCDSSALSVLSSKLEREHALLLREASGPLGPHHVVLAVVSPFQWRFPRAQSTEHTAQPWIPWDRTCQARGGVHSPKQCIVIGGAFCWSKQLQLTAVNSGAAAGAELIQR